MHEGVSRRGACTTKRAYVTYAGALTAVYRRVAQGCARESLYIYHCKKGKCGKFHVATKITKGRKGKR